jgi:MFS family permease
LKGGLCLKNLQASTIYLYLRFTASLANTIMFTTYAVYYVNELGLNPFQLVLIGTILEVTILLLEGVTGVVADTYSRRLSIIIGMFVLGIAYIVEGSIPFITSDLLQHAIPFFAMLIVAEVIRGVGETFLSGAGSAWITDEVGEDKIGKLFIRGRQLGQAASIIGVVISVALASIALNIPYLVGGVLYLGIGVFLLIYMPETAFKKEDKESSNPLKSMSKTFQDGVGVVRGNPVLMMMLLVVLFSGAASEGFARLWEAHFLENFRFPALGNLEPVVWFGVFVMGGNLLSIAGAELFNRRFDTNHHGVIKRSLFVLTIFHVLFLVSFGVANSFVWALVSFWAVQVILSISGPMFEAWLNQNIKSRSRATVLSIISQSDAIGQAGGGPVVGLVGTRYTIRAAMVFSAILILPTIAIFAKLGKSSFKRQEKNSIKG